ncbi:hypothetical protein BCR36DRAFT_358228, partial [Piromyces finnis]
MIKLFHFLYYTIFITIYYLKSFSKEIYISFNDENFNNLKDIINDNQVSNEGLVLYFNDSYYDMTNLPYTIDITVNSNISFIGNKNGTVFDYKGDKKGRLIFNYFDNKERKIKIENISFENFNNFGIIDIEMIILNTKSDNIFLTFDDCIVRNNNYRFLRIDYACNMPSHSEPSIIFNNCEFLNNSLGIMKLVHSFGYRNNKLNKCMPVVINNSSFINNNGLFIPTFSKITINNCYFSKIEKAFDDNKEVTLYHSYGSKEDLTINNSTFNNINIKSASPLFTANNINLKISNTTFSKCYSGYGYLFYIKSSENMDHKQKIIINNSTFSDICTIFQGNKLEYEIYNSRFENITIKNALPIIANSKYSTFKIENTIFQNMNLTNALFEKESLYSLNNVKLTHIKTNSIAILHFIYNNISLNNIEVEDIQCIGDSDNTSFILFNSGEKYKYLDITNMKIQNSISNGPFIKICGDNNEISIKNSFIKNIRSYGSIIENQSKMSKTTILNINFNNNINKNKLDCGNIHFTNNINLQINNSIFSNNYCENNGGAICFNKITNLKINITSSIFNKNTALNGGSLYINDESYLFKNHTILNIVNNTFINNIAKNFGGAVYSKFNNTYISNSYNNSIINNNAGISGGGIYSSGKTIVNLNKLSISNNTAHSYVSDYASKPSYILLNNTITSKITNIITGDYISLKFLLYDEYDNILEDISKYYSSLNIKSKLVEINDVYDDDPKKKIKLKGNICYFSKGHCEFNNLQVFAKPNKYKLIFYIDNDDDDIELRFDDIEINISECNENQIKRYNNNGILYCVNPICKSDCPVGDSAECIPYYKELINDVEKNICKCLPGWNGSSCKNKEFIDFSFIKYGILIINVPFIIIVLLYILFIILNKKQGIIKDLGFYKIIIFSIGILLFFTSNLFTVYSNQYQCLLNFILKHVGTSLVFFIYIIINILSLELGIEFNKEDEKKLDKIRSSCGLESESKDDDYSINIKYLEKPSNYSLSDVRKSSSSLCEDDVDNDNNKKEIRYNTEIIYSPNYIENLIILNIINKKKEKKEKNNSNLHSSFMKTAYIDNFFFNSTKGNLQINGNYEEDPNKYILRSIKNGYISFIRALFLYIVFLIITFTVPFHNILFNERKYGKKADYYLIQNNDGLWVYSCHLEKPDFLFNIFHFIFLMIILIKGKKLMNYKLIFNCTQNITYSTVIAIILGPFTNIISFAILNKQIYGKVVFDYVSNTIAYLVIFIMFSWDKIYYISIKEGNNTNVYFLFKRYKKCLIHHSYKCGCILNEKECNHTLVINKYLLF